MKAKVCAAIDAWAAKVEALAQDIEREPELGFKETKTAAKVTAFLQQLGLAPQTGLALTGVKARVVSDVPDLLWQCWANWMRRVSGQL